MKDIVYLAPLHGFTDYIFRNVYFKHFQGVDYVISPFISLTHGTKITSKKVKDMNPQNNKSINVIPQVLGNEADLFIQLAKFLETWGYKTLNWNLGCPIKGIVNKKRGSGLLPYPSEIRNILDKVIPQISQKLSVKVRLGYDNPDEIFKLVAVFNDYPLDFVCVHPRIGTQMYDGKIDYNAFDKIILEFNAPLIYNGDIVDIGVFNLLKTKYSTINNWMIGRSILYNPVLPAQIKGVSIAEKNTYFEDYIFDLYNTLLVFKTEIRAINKIKDYWFFLANRFYESKMVLDIITHCQTIKQIFDKTKYIFNEFTTKY